MQQELESGEWYVPDPGDPGSEGAAPKSGLLCGKIQVGKMSMSRGAPAREKRAPGRRRDAVPLPGSGGLCTI